MKQQFLPLLLCLFIAFFTMSFHSYSKNIEDNKYTTNINFTDITGNKAGFLFLKSSIYNKFNVLGNKHETNGYSQYYSENDYGGGILLNEDFSYNIIEDSPAPSIFPIIYQTNLFSQGLYYGFVLTVVLFNLVCFFIFEERLYLKFSFAVAAFTVVLFFSEGLFPLIGLNDYVKNQTLLSSFLVIAIGISSLFASRFLLINENFSKLKYFTIPVFSFSALLVLASWLTEKTTFSKTANILLFGILGLYFLTGVLLFSKNNYSKFYVIATFIPLLFSVDYFVLKPFGIDFLFTEAIHLKIATLFEVIILSYAIIYRMKEIKEEGELRQTELRIFLKRQDIMSRTQVEQLVEDVYLENLIMQYDLDGLEIKLLQYISEGKPNTKISKKLKLSEDEVIEHTKYLYNKLEISEHIQEDYRMVDSQPDYIYN